MLMEEVGVGWIGMRSPAFPRTTSLARRAGVPRRPPNQTHATHPHTRPCLAAGLRTAWRRAWRSAPRRCWRAALPRPRPTCWGHWATRTPATTAPCGRRCCHTPRWVGGWVVASPAAREWSVCIVCASLRVPFGGGEGATEARGRDAAVPKVARQLPGLWLARCCGGVDASCLPAGLLGSLPGTRLAPLLANDTDTNMFFNQHQGGSVLGSRVTGLDRG